MIFITGGVVAFMASLTFIYGTIQIPTGYVGVIYSWGALQPNILEVGHNFELRPWSRVEGVDILPQTDIIDQIVCHSKDGMQIVFPKVIVHNQLHKENAYEMIKTYRANYDEYLVKQPIRQKMIEMCTEKNLHHLYIEEFADLNEILKEYLVDYQKEHKNLLVINRVSIEKPIIPEKVKRNYETIVEERTRLTAEEEIQKRKLKEKETERMQKEAHAAMERSMANIENSRSADKAESDAKISRINAESDAKKMEIESEAKAKSIKVIADAEKERHTREYLELEYYRNVAANADIYYGDKLPQYVGNPLKTK
jgi:erlin